MEEFDLSVIALLDGIDALPELSAATCASPAAASAAPGADTPLQLHSQLQRAVKSPQLDSSEDDASDIDSLRMLHETDHLLDSLEVATLLATAPSSLSPLPQQQHVLLAAAAQTQEQMQQPHSVQFAPHGTTTSCSIARTHTNASNRKSGSSGSGGKPGKSRNLSRERLKSELTYLRQQVRDLEDELRVLRPGSTLAGGGANAADLLAVDRKKAILPVWQRIAERQLESRTRVETENARLKALLEGQIKLAKSLEQMLRKRPNVSVFSGGAAMSPGKKPRLELDDDSIYEMLEAGLEPAYRSMDAVFQANGLANTCDESIRHAHIKTRRRGDSSAIGGLDDCDTDADYLYLELADVFVIPFDLQVSANAAWRSVTQQYLNASHAVYRNVAQPEDTIAVKFHATSYRRYTDTHLEVQLVMRRFVEPHRLVIVWRTMSKGARQLSGMYTDETGWCVLKKIPATATNGPPAIGTVMQSCVHVVPKRSGSVLHENVPEVGMLSKIIGDAYEDDVIAINKTMENLLLDEALSLSTTGTSGETSTARAASSASASRKKT